MDIPWDKLSSSYVIALSDMLKNFEAAPNRNSKFNVLKNFSKNYLMHPQYWLQLLDLLPDAQEYTYYQNLAGVHFFSTSYNQWKLKHLYWEGYDNLFQQCTLATNTITILKKLEESLSFPHKHLKICLELLKNLSAKPISNLILQKYKKSLDLMKKMENAGDDDDQWLECLKEIDHDKSVSHNIEYRLGLEWKCTNKKIWKFYIQHFKKCLKQNKNFIKRYNEFLHVYYRYSHFFVNDREMRDEFRLELENADLHFPNITYFWMDLIESELKYGTLEHAHCILESGLNSFLQKPLPLFRRSREEFEKNMEFFGELLKRYRCRKRNVLEANGEIPEHIIAIFDYSFKPTPETKIKKSINPKYNTNNQFDQRMSLPKPLIRYFLDSSAPSMLQKMFDSCKLMFPLHPTPVIYRLEIGDGICSEYFQQSLILSINDLHRAKFSNLYVGNVLNFESKDRKALSRFLPKIKKCIANLVCIFHQDLLHTEFTFITSNVKYLCLKNTKIKNENGSIISSGEIKAIFDQQVKISIE